MSHHFYLHFGPGMWPLPLRGLLRSGFMGVDLFFVLSGFVMSMVYGNWFDGSSPRRGRLVAVFLVRRVARLWPLHAAVLAILLALDIMLSRSAGSARMIGANFTMIQAWGITAEINSPAWSISAEFLAYLVFPAIATFVLRSRMGALGAAVAIVLLLWMCVALTAPLGPGRRGLLDVYQNYSTLPCLRCLGGFVTGMLASRASQVAFVRRWCSTTWTGPAALALFAALLLSEVDGIVAYPLLPVIVLGLHHGRGAVCRAFAAGPLYRLGVLSYAVYLIHYALLEVFPVGNAPLWMAIGLYAAVTYGLALLAHAAVEVPGRLLLRRVGEMAVGRLLPMRRVVS